MKATAIGASFVLAVVAAVQWITMSQPREAVERSVSWWKLGGVDIRAGIHVDGLTVMMLVVVTFISLLVQVYSVAYLRGDPRFPSYSAVVSLFTAAMALVVTAALAYFGFRLNAR